MATKYNSSNNALLASAQNSLDNIEAKLANNMNTEVSSNKYDSVIKSSDSDSELNKLKSKIEIGKITIAGTNKSADSNITLPSKIVDVFAEPILEKINDTSINEYSKTNYWKQCLQQVMNALNKIDSKVEKNNGISYKIDYDNLTWSMNGIGTISATVTWTKNKTNYETKLSWLSLDKEALQSYYDSLNQLGNALINDVWKKLITGLASDVAKGTSKVIKALYGNDTKQNLLKEVFGNKIIKDATKAKLKAIIKEIFSNTNTGTTVISNAEKYEDLVYLYSSLESAINNNEDTSKIEKDFIDKANTIEKSLGITTLTTLNTSEAENKYLTYNKGMNQITVPSGYGNELKSSDYNSKVTKIDASGRTAAIIIEGNKKGNTIYGGSGKDSLNGGLGNDKLYGGAGDDTLEGGKGTDKLTGGDGSNVFYYSNGDGKDTILDYKAGQDKIQLGSNTTIKKVKMSGKNAIFTIGSGKITVKNVKGKNITVVDSNNNETTYLNGKVTSSGGSNNNGGNNNGDGTTKPTGESVNRNGVKVVIDDDTNGTFKLDEYNANKSASNKAVNIDASNNEQSLTIYGDDRDNIISAGSGSNTIYGGAGDDVLYSGSYSATRFYYNKGDGDDIIYDIKDNDYIGTNDCSVTDISVSDEDIVLSIASGVNLNKDIGSITIKNGVNKYLYINSQYSWSKYASSTVQNGEFVLDENAGGTFDLTQHYGVSSTAKNINASDNENSLTIYGDDRDNIISAGSGSNTIYGGAGNDVLYSGHYSSTTFAYNKGDGNDVVYNLKNYDNIRTYDCSVKSTSVSGRDVVITVASGNNLDKDVGTITLKNAVDVYFYLNGSGQDFSSTKNFVESSAIDEPWFANDDNFGDNEISGLIFSSTDNAINLTDLNTDYSSLSPKDKSSYQSTLAGQKRNVI